MKIIIEKPNDGEEECITIRCHELDDKILSLISNINDDHEKLVGYDNDNIHKIDLISIFYFESVNNKVFIYTEKNMYESKLKLYEIEYKLKSNNFFRASKSIILSINKIDYVTPAFGGRFEANLLNGEKVIVSRKYLSDFKKILDI